MMRRSTLWIPVVTLALALVPFTRAAAHQSLLRSSPADSAVLMEVPTGLRLTFNQAVEPALAQVRLVGPDGEVALGAHRVPADAPTVLVAAITGRLAAGAYTIHWVVTGDDGHPVNGEIHFTVAEGAAGLAVDTVAPTRLETPGGASAAAHADSAPEPADAESGPVVSTGSPLYGAVRWFTFAGIVTAIGAVSFALLLLPGVERRGGPAASAIARARVRAAGVGLVAAAALGIAAVLRLGAQLAALRIPGGRADSELVAAMVTRTLWGWGWIVQAVAAIVLLGGLWQARRGRRGGWIVAGVAVVALAGSPALSGHAAATSAVAVVADALHVLSAGGWLGTLLVMVVVGVPLLLDRAESRRADAASLLGAFSPLALTFAAILTLTGVYAAWLHLPALADLWSTVYGQTLLIKLAAVVLVIAAGLYNWRRARPAVERDDDLRPLRRSATTELAMGALVLAVTAALVATPPPREAQALAAPVAPAAALSPDPGPPP